MAADINVDSAILSDAKIWLDQKFEDLKYRVAIVRNGCLVAEWTQQMVADEKIKIASAAKPLCSGADS